MINVFAQLGRPIYLTIAPEADRLPAHCLERLLDVHLPQVVHADGRLDLYKVIAQHVLGELVHAERIEAPVDRMPALECVI